MGAQSSSRTLKRRAALSGRLLRIALLAGAAALPMAASAEIYGWVDANGTVTYSNLPPPKGAQITDVIHENPVSPEMKAEQAHRTEVAALNDRLRLLELELARSQRQVVDYPDVPPAPAGVGCGPSGAMDCNPGYDYGPYLSTGLLYGGRFGVVGAHQMRPRGGHGTAILPLSPPLRLAHGASRTAAPAASHLR